MIETTTVLSVPAARTFEVDQAALLNRQVGDAEALLLEMAAGVQDALVLRDGSDDVVAAVLVEFRHALDGEIVRLGGARGEHHLLLVCTNQLAELGARLLDRLLCLPPIRMAARMRIAELVGEVRHHRLQDARIERRGRLVVEVDRLIVAPDLGKNGHANPCILRGLGMWHIRLRYSGI